MHTHSFRLAIDLMHMTSQGRPRMLGVKRGTVTCAIAKHAASRPTPACHTAGPARARALRGWERQCSSSTTRARSVTSLDPQHGIVVMETWRQCIRSILRGSAVRYVVSPKIIGYKRRWKQVNYTERQKKHHFFRMTLNKNPKHNKYLDTDYLQYSLLSTSHTPQVCLNIKGVTCSWLARGHFQKS